MIPKRNVQPIDLPCNTDSHEDRLRSTHIKRKLVYNTHAIHTYVRDYII